MSETKKNGRSNDDADHRLRELDERLALQRRKSDPAYQEGSGREVSGIGKAVRLVSEFASAILVGILMGYGIDQLLGSTPWGILIFLLIGFAAGLLNLVRAAKRLEMEEAGFDETSSKDDL